MRDPELEPAGLPGLPERVDAYAERAARVADVTPRTFAPPGTEDFGTALEATLQAQYACYVEGVAMAEWLGRRYPPCGYAAGYSMGLFAAAAHVGAVSFEDGLRILREVCRAGHAAVPDAPYAVGAVFGMGEAAVEREVARVGAGVEVTDVNGPLSILVTGGAGPVNAVVEACVREGAAETRVIPVTAPFHSSAMAGAEPAIEVLLQSVPLADPRVPLVSCGTRRLLATAGDVREELARNISRPLNWYETMRTLVGLQVGLFLECGTSKRLKGMAKREVPGAYNFHAFPDFAAHG